MEENRQGKKSEKLSGARLADSQGLSHWKEAITDPQRLSHWKEAITDPQGLSHPVERSVDLHVLSDKQGGCLTPVEGVVDLHVHSNKSDGSLTPAEVVDLGVEKGLCALALTDHDTTAGLEEGAERAAWHRAQGRQLEFIPGIEFSTEYEGRDIHIVGLFIDKENSDFKRNIRHFVDSRELRNQKMCRSLQAGGIEISYEKLLAEFPGAVITRAHYARYLLAHGYVKSLPEAFERYVGDRCRYFVPREKVTPAQAVRLILQAGGIPILAHPILYRMSTARLDALVSQLKEAGLMGLEAIYSSYSPAEERQMRRLAEKHGLCISGGSDFHGAAKPRLELATGYGKLRVPKSVLLALKEARQNLTSVCAPHPEIRPQ